jgi:hypothetical protein
MPEHQPADRRPAVRAGGLGMASPVPLINTFVKWGRTLPGGVFVAAGIALAKK